MSDPAQPTDQPIDELRGHEFDGIAEFDNRLPNWWLATFYVACVFSLFYWLHYHVAKFGPLPGEAYRAAVAADDLRRATELAREPLTDASLLELASLGTEIEAGRDVFVANCATCHLESGAGSVGPNLTDDYWLHGGSPTAIFATIEKGIIDKGMVAWRDLLTLDQRKKVTAFILSIGGTNVSGGKAPQGQKESPSGG